MKNIYIFTGGTISPIAPHAHFGSSAYGLVGDKLFRAFSSDRAEVVRKDGGDDYQVYLITTAMASNAFGYQNSVTKNHFSRIGLDPNVKIKTNEDVGDIVDHLVKLEETRCIVMATAMCDYDPVSINYHSDENGGRTNHNYKVSGMLEERIHNSPKIYMSFEASEKIINRVRKTRKDIFLVSFKATADLAFRETYIQALNNLKGSSSNLVLANDIITKTNMIVTPEEFPYPALGRDDAIAQLAKMTYGRINSKFTRSIVVKGDLIKWDSEEIPSSLVNVVDHCIDSGAYKEFRGSTVGHFACRGNLGSIYTSVRKSNFNHLKDNGLVKIRAVDENNVIAFGAKPSVGGQSQRIIFDQHKNDDCIVHFHCPMKRGAKIPVRPQRFNECGSHECGRNTSEGLVEVAPGIKAVMLDNHGPNIVFGKDQDPQKVIDFIDDNWDLSLKTGGSVAV
jgi:hypothetical protein